MFPVSQNIFRHRIQYLSWAMLITFLLCSGCSRAMLFGPPGDRVGTVEGRMQIDGGSATKFRVDVYSQSGEDLSFWLSLPNRGVRYKRIEDIDFEDGLITIMTSSPKRAYSCVVSEGPMKFKGELEQIAGSFILNLK